MRANTQTLRNLRNRITPLRDLGNRIPLEIITEIYPAHLRLLTSKLGKKVSRNLGAIQVGLAAILFTAPPVAFWPNNVPCGPLRISTRSRSNEECFVRTGKGSGISST